MTRNTNTETTKTRETKAPAFIAYVVTEKGDNSYWTRVGAAFEHKDGEGFTVDLELLPVNGGRFVLRTPKEANDKEKGA